MKKDLMAGVSVTVAVFVLLLPTSLMGDVVSWICNGVGSVLVGMVAFYTYSLIVKSFSKAEETSRIMKDERQQETMLMLGNIEELERKKAELLADLQNKELERLDNIEATFLKVTNGMETSLKEWVEYIGNSLGTLAEANSNHASTVLDALGALKREIGVLTTSYVNTFKESGAHLESTLMRIGNNLTRHMDEIEIARNLATKDYLDKAIGQFSEIICLLETFSDNLTLQIKEMGDGFQADITTLLKSNLKQEHTQEALLQAEQQRLVEAEKRHNFVVDGQKKELDQLISIKNSITTSQSRIESNWNEMKKEISDHINMVSKDMAKNTENLCLSLKDSEVAMSSLFVELNRKMENIVTEFGKGLDNYNSISKLVEDALAENTDSVRSNEREIQILQNIINNLKELVEVQKSNFEECVDNLEDNLDELVNSFNNQLGQNNESLATKMKNLGEDWILGQKEANENLKEKFETILQNFQDTFEDEFSGITEILRNMEQYQQVCKELMAEDENLIEKFKQLM